MRKKLQLGRYDYASYMMLSTYSACSIAVPVTLVQISKELGFSLGAGGGFQLGRSLMMVTSMVLCGLLAGRLGMRKALGYSQLLMALSILVAVMANSYVALLIPFMGAGLGEGSLEGLATPFVGQLHKNDEPGRYITVSHAFWSVGIFFTVLVAGYLLKIGVSWRWILGVCGFFALLPLIVIFGKPKANGQKYPESKKRTPAKVTLARTKKIMLIPRFWIYFVAMFFAGGGEFCLTFWCASYIQEELNGSAFMGGFATAIFALGMLIGRIYFGSHVKEKNFKKLIVITAFFGVIMGMIFPWLTSIKMTLIALFFLGLANAPYWPSIQSYAATTMKVDNTMLFILLSCAGIPGSGSFTYLLGLAGDRFGFVASFYLVPACYLIMGLLIAYDKFNFKKIYKGK